MAKVYCAECGKEIVVGEDVLSIETAEGFAFCSRKCMGNWLYNNKADEIIDS